MRSTRYLLLLLASLALSQAVAAQFALPATTGWSAWEAEAANRSGAWATVSDPSAGGGQYVTTDDRTATLQYHFKVDRETTVRVRPVWWRTGQARSGRRFPYPLPQQFGPETVELVGNSLFFLCPAAQNLGLFDTTTDKLAPTPVGGYPTDLAYDARANCVYVANATENCVVVADAKSGAVLKRWPTAGQPWALALVGDRLYVACRGGKCVQVLSTASGAALQTLPLEAAPIGLEAVGTPPTSLTVRFQQSPLQMQTLELPEPDQLQYNARPSRTYVTAGKDKRYECDRAKPVIRAIKTSGGTTEIDLSQPTPLATAKAPVGVPGYPLAGNGPTVILIVKDKLFACLSAAGRVAVIDTKTDTLLKTFDLGGYPVDLAATPKNDKVYVADAAGNTVFAIDPAKLEVTGKLAVPAGPTSLQVVETYNLQRPYMTPGLQIWRLFVGCTGDKSVAAVDLKTDKLVQTVPLGFAPRYLKLVPSPNPDWWPALADDRIPFAMTPKLAIEPMPLSLDLATSALQPAVDAGEGIARRNSAKLTMSGAEKTISANGNMLLQITGAPGEPKRQIDCTSLCDTQRAADQPLRSIDQPGSLTVSLDGGADLDWRRGVWTRPDNGGFLVYDTDEYWEWNAPALRVKPGDHVLTVKSRDEAVRLDAVAVAPTGEAAVDMAVRPEPWALHSQVPSGAYQGVFYDTEAVSFTATLRNSLAATQRVTLGGTVTNYMGKIVAQLPAKPVDLTASGTAAIPLPLDLKDTGRFTLTLTVTADSGAISRDLRFVRLPKLEHPRLLFRADQEPAIRARIAAHPVLYKRYSDWLVRMTAKEGKFPERFLPNGLLQSELAQAAPPDSKDPGGQYGWRMYELGWRMLGAQFASRYLPGADKATLDARMKPLLNAPTSATWSQYHHHGPFFPGAVEGVVDMAPTAERANLPLTAFFAKYRGNMDVYPYTLMSLEEPVSPADRALIYRIAIQHDNFDTYFTAHAGNRGGTWWQNPWSWCYCPTQGIFLSQMFTANFFGETRWAQKPFFQGYLTFMQQADPISDKSNLLPALRRPSGEPWRWVLTAVTRDPLEKWEYGWDEWLKKMEGPLPNEGQAVDDLMALKGMPLAGPLEAAPHRFATVVSVPVALALGWYEPKAPTVKWDELPPTTLLNPEGWARMRSGWGADDTELWFMSGVRDHTTRHQPNNLMVARAGRFLVGLPALWADDGNCSPSWGNTVVAGDRWLQRWQTNLFAPRSEEKDLINRFTPENWTYLSRERQLNGYAAAEGGWGGGTDLHGHTETLMLDDGRIIGYQTSPAYDYVAGETTGAWPVDEIESHQRQLVFLKPDTIVLYDRVRLGPNGHPSKWLAATGPDLAINGSSFTVTNSEVKMAGQVLLPREPKLEAAKPYDCYQWKKQQLLQITNPAEGSEAEYLVVMTTGGQKLSPAQATVKRSAEYAEVTVTAGGAQYTIRFNRRGPVGGQIAWLKDRSIVQRDLPTGIEDTYRNWSADPRYRKWVTEARFGKLIPVGDRVRK